MDSRDFAVRAPWALEPAMHNVENRRAGKHPTRVDNSDFVASNGDKLPSATMSRSLANREILLARCFAQQVRSVTTG